MSMSKVVLGAVSAVIGAAVSIGIVVPSIKKEQPILLKPPVTISYAPSIAPFTIKEVNLTGIAQMLPPDPIDPKPTPRPTPKPVVPTFNTIGCQFPAIYDKWWLHPYDQVAYLAGLVEGETYRTNVMFNWEGHFQHEIEATSVSGVVLGSLSFDTYMLEPCSPDNITYKDGVCSGMFQLNQFITHIDATYTGVYSIRIKPLGGTGKIFFYATMIDNRSSDCTTFTQFRRTKSNNIWSESGLYYQGSFDAETERP